MSSYFLGGFSAYCTVPSGRHRKDRKSTRLNSSHLVISYAVFCLKKKKHVEHLKTLRGIIVYSRRKKKIMSDYDALHEVHSVCHRVDALNSTLIRLNRARLISADE